MKTNLLSITIVAAMLLVSCSDRKAAEEKARQDAEAKARADAERKEMQALPQTFKPVYFNKRLDATDQTGATTTAPANQTKNP
jgi:hypothetical protein